MMMVILVFAETVSAQLRLDTGIVAARQNINKSCRLDREHQYGGRTSKGAHILKFEGRQVMKLVA